MPWLILIALGGLVLYEVSQAGKPAPGPGPSPIPKPPGTPAPDDPCLDAGMTPAQRDAVSKALAYARQASTPASEVSAAASSLRTLGFPVAAACLDAIAKKKVGPPAPKVEDCLAGLPDPIKAQFLAAVGEAQGGASSDKIHQAADGLRAMGFKQAGDCLDGVAGGTVAKSPAQAPVYLSLYKG
jgi:hypothetical protein